MEEHILDRVAAFTAGAKSSGHFLGLKKLGVTGDVDGLKEILIFKLLPPALKKDTRSLLISSAMKIIHNLGRPALFK